MAGSVTVEIETTTTVAEEYERLTTAKTAIATAIENKGVTVPSGTKLDGMADLIGSIESGGGGGGSTCIIQPIKKGSAKFSFCPFFYVSSDGVVCECTESDIGTSIEIYCPSFIVSANPGSSGIDLSAYIDSGLSNSTGESIFTSSGYKIGILITEDCFVNSLIM